MTQPYHNKNDFLMKKKSELIHRVGCNKSLKYCLTPSATSHHFSDKRKARKARTSVDKLTQVLQIYITDLIIFNLFVS